MAETLPMMDQSFESLKKEMRIVKKHLRKTENDSAHGIELLRNDFSIFQVDVKEAIKKLEVSVGSLVVLVKQDSDILSGLVSDFTTLEGMLDDLKTTEGGIIAMNLETPEENAAEAVADDDDDDSAETVVEHEDTMPLSEPMNSTVKWSDLEIKNSTEESNPEQEGSEFDRLLSSTRSHLSRQFSILEDYQKSLDELK